MSDFDAALERLVSDPAFRTALSTDPTAALAGYRLSPDEWELLHAQVDAGAGGERQVEQRTSKASLFGLLSPLAGAGGLGSGIGEALRGSPPGPDGLGAGVGRHALPEPRGADRLVHGDRLGRPDERLLEPGPRAPGAAFGGVVADMEPLAVPTEPEVQARGTVYTGAAAARHHGDTAADQPPSGDYHTRVDADGDGRWDRFTAIDRGAGGVDLVVDRDNDGRPEFVGSDLDRDGLIDYASTDTDRDGRLDTRWVDDDGDGWLDRSVPEPDPHPGGGRHASPGPGGGRHASPEPEPPRPAA